MTSPTPDSPLPATTSRIEAIPGPYSYGRDAEGVDDLWVIFSQSTGQDIAYIRFWDEPEDSELEESEANARLLSSAPQLRDALKALLVAVAELPRERLSIDIYQAELAADSILAKAEGRS